jgi:hypothetical protein
LRQIALISSSFTKVGHEPQNPGIYSHKKRPRYSGKFGVLPECHERKSDLWEKALSVRLSNKGKDIHNMNGSRMLVRTRRFVALSILVCSTFFALSSQAFAAVVHPNDFVDTVNPATYVLGCGTGWSDAFDGNQSFQYAYTTGSQACSRAVWDEHDKTQNMNCGLLVYIPTIFATARISYGVYRSDGSLIGRYTINQKERAKWTQLTLTGNIHGIHHVLIQSNNGENGTDMAAGPMIFSCSYA